MQLLAVTLAACGSSAPPPAPEPVVARPVEPAPAPVVAVDPDRIERVVVGESTTCVVRGDGTTQCRGRMPLARTALGGPPDVSDQAVCTRAEGRQRCVRKGVDQVRQTAFVELTTGAGAPCGRDAEGSVFCFHGQPEDNATLRPVPLDRPAERVLSDGFREYALLDDGRLFSWDPYQAMLGSPEVQLVDEDVVEVDGTYLQTCWRTAREVRCRGEGKARKIRGVEDPAQLTVGRLHACVLRDGVPWCWGDSSFGQLGKRRSSREAAVKVEGVDDAVSIDAGYDHTCVLRRSGEVYCWGRDDAGQVAGTFP